MKHKVNNCTHCFWGTWNNSEMPLEKSGGTRNPGIFINVPNADKLKTVCILKSAQDKRKDFLSLDL